MAARLWTFLVAALAALLCKEVAVIALITVFICPAVRLEKQHQRRTWLMSVSVLLAAWGAAYLWVYSRASLTIPGPGGGHWPSLVWLPGIALVPWWSIKAIWSLPPSSGMVDVLVVVGLVVSTPWSRVVAIVHGLEPEVRAWWLWGLAWSLPMVLTLVPLFPAWGPHRLALAGFGAAAATMVTLKSVHRHAIWIFLLVRLLLLALAPAPVRQVSVEPPARGATLDVPRLSRLQRFIADVRHVLRARYPRLPHDAVVVQENFPAMTESAFGLRPAVHVWYRDTSLRWVPISQWIASPTIPVATVVEYQGDRKNEIALVEPEAMRALILASAAMNEGRESESLRLLARAESLQVDTSAVVFRGSLVGKRHYALARLRFQEGRYNDARSELAALLVAYPGDVPGRRLLKEVEEALAESRPGR
jgi:hypothetical protein